MGMLGAALVIVTVASNWVGVSTHTTTVEFATVAKCEREAERINGQPPADRVHGDTRTPTVSSRAFCVVK